LQGPRDARHCAFRWRLLAAHVRSARPSLLHAVPPGVIQRASRGVRRCGVPPIAMPHSFESQRMRTAKHLQASSRLTNLVLQGGPELRIGWPGRMRLGALFAVNQGIVA